MLVLTRLRNATAGVGLELLGWILVPLGIIMMPAPGPGTLVLLGGIALLARQYAWARFVLSWLETRAIEAAKFGVATWPRIALSAAGCVWLFVLGAIWLVGPNIPEFTVADFTVPGGLVTGGYWTLVVAVSVVALVALRRLARVRDRARFVIFTAMWLTGLWFAVFRCPDLGDRSVVLQLGPELPAQGWVTAAGIWAGGVLAVALLVFSIVKWREPEVVSQ
ncbi:MAG TPA: PGPGW domain-containing protein [Aeromicrobium sp.]|nr:PGPGW domain-containing protein [Aeromicrobium sp.]